MAKGKPTALIHAKYLNTFEALSDEEAGKLIKHFMRYICDKQPEAPDRLTGLMFEPMKIQLKSELKVWEAICSKNKANGVLGGRPAKITQPNPTEPKEPIGLIDKQPVIKVKLTDAQLFVDSITNEWKPIVQRWLDYKKEKGQSYKGKTSLATMYKSLLSKSGNSASKGLEIVDFSIGNNYSGLFEPKGNVASQSGKILQPTTDEKKQALLDRL